MWSKRCSAGARRRATPVHRARQSETGRLQPAQFQQDAARRRVRHSRLRQCRRRDGAADARLWHADSCDQPARRRPTGSRRPPLNALIVAILAAMAPWRTGLTPRPPFAILVVPHDSEERTLIRVIIIATCAGSVALSTISAQAAPSSPGKVLPTGLTVSPIVPAANGCGYGYRRTQWQDQWGRWHLGHCIS